MIEHKKSDGTSCAGCPDTCEDRNIPIVINGVDFRGCCAMRGGPHGTFIFDDDGNVTNVPLCCAGYDHAMKACDPDRCSAHSGKPEWAVKVVGIAGAGAFGRAKAEAKARKVAIALDVLNGVTDRADEFAAISLAGKVFRGGVRWHEDSGEIEAEIVVMEKRVNLHNPDPEWHLRAPTTAEKKQIEAALRAALGVN